MNEGRKEADSLPCRPNMGLKAATHGGYHRGGKWAPWVIGLPSTPPTPPSPAAPPRPPAMPSAASRSGRGCRGVGRTKAEGWCESGECGRAWSSPPTPGSPAESSSSSSSPEAPSSRLSSRRLSWARGSLGGCVGGSWLPPPR